MPPAVAEFDAAAAQLSAATAALIGEAACATARFGIAVSGGPDSVALLLLAHHAFPGRIEAATIDHRLRAASADEAAFVARLCAERCIAHATLSPDEPISGNVQANARAARYALLERWRAARGIDWLMTAHHADDQLETLVMRINRSSGVGGMAGIRERQGRVLRPLLAMRHAALVELVAGQAIVPVDDPSNSDARFDRARIRKALSDCSLVDPVSTVATARALADADAAIDWMVERLTVERLTGNAAEWRLDTTDLPAELLRRLVVQALNMVEPARAAPRGTALSAVIVALSNGEKTMIGATLIEPMRAAPTTWRLYPAPPHRALSTADRTQPPV